MPPAPPRVWVARTITQRQRSLATRHDIFCCGDGDGGEILERCPAFRSAPHDRYDRRGTRHLGATYRRRDVATARLIVARHVVNLPTGRISQFLERPPAIVPGRRYAEPSRVALLASYQGTDLGKSIRLRLVGRLAETAMGLGYPHYLLTIRPVLFRSLSWLPWDLAPPILYPSREGGPIKREPLWPCTLNLHELVAATKQLRPHYYLQMFPDEPAWYDPTQVRSPEIIADLAAANAQYVKDCMIRWEKGARLLVLADTGYEVD